MHADVDSAPTDETASRLHADPAPLPPVSRINLLAMYFGQGLVLGLLLAVPLFHAATFLSPEKEELGLVTDVDFGVDEPGAFIMEVTAPSGTWLVSTDKIFGQYEYQQKLDRAEVEPVTVIYSSLTGSLVAVPELEVDDRGVNSIMWPALAFAVLMAGVLRATAFYFQPNSTEFGVAFAFGLLVIGTPIGLAFFEGIQEAWQRVG